MPTSALSAYMKNLEARRAEFKLMIADVLLLTKKNKKNVEATLQNWMKVLDIQNEKNARPASPIRLRLMGIGVKEHGK